MRKEVISHAGPGSVPDTKWLDLDSIAMVQVTSEEQGSPIDAALLEEGQGWRAASKGTQTIRLIFDKPQTVTRIWLTFHEAEIARTQEFVLRWSSGNENSFREIVRQQWNFSSPDSVQETEDYAVQLSGVKMVELIIVPDKSGGEARASLRKLRLA